MATPRLVSPDEQLENVVSWNRSYDLRFSSQQIADAERAAKTVPRPNRDKMQVAVLVPYLGTVGSTFETLWSVISDSIRTTRGDNTNSDPDHMQLAPGIEHVPGLRWELVSLGPYKNYRQPPAACRSTKSAHAAALAAAAHMPDWARTISDKNQPDLVLAGYQVRFSGAPKPSPWKLSYWLHRASFRRILLLDVILDRPPNLYHISTPESVPL